MQGRTNLSPLTTRFVGREAQLAELRGLLTGGAHTVVAVLGPAGVGKSRLAAEAGRRRLLESEDARVARCDLTSVRTLDAALRQLGDALGLTFGPAEARSQVVDRLAASLGESPDLWLILDDAEGVIDALTETLRRIIETTPSCRVVVTSRRPVSGVPHGRVDLLPLPEDEALSLLVDRARRVRPDFVLPDRLREVVLTLLRRVDALPLSIELLAPRMRLLTPPQLLDRFSGAAGERASLRATIERSWELLRPWEREALAQTSVFRDGFTLEAAEAVVDLQSHPDAPDVLSVLEGLVAQSLLRTVTVSELPDEVRIRHFVAVQELASERGGDLGGAQARHAAYYLERGEAWDEGIESARELTCTRRLVLELPNLEAAHERSELDPARRCRFALLLHMAYQRRGPFSAQSELVEDAVDHARTLADGRLLARAVLARARVRRWAGQLAASAEDLEDALACSREAGDVATEAACLRNLAAVSFQGGDAAAMKRHIEAALDAARRSGRPSDEVNARNGLGYVLAMEGNLDGAQDEHESALRLARQTGTPGLIALVTAALSELMLKRGRIKEAERYSTETLERYEELGYLRQRGNELLVRGRARCLAGQTDAMPDAQQALALARRLGLRELAARAQALAGLCAFSEGRFAEAHALLETVGDLRGPAGAEARAYDAAARAMVGHVVQAEDAVARARDAGEDADRLRVISGFVELSRARQAARAGQPVDLGSLNDLAREAAAGPAELRRAGEVLRACLDDLAQDVFLHRGPSIRMEVGEDATWFCLPPGERVDISRRRALRGIMRALADQRLTHPGVPLHLDEVLEAGWPGERMTPDSGARRVYVTINRLRKLGLGDLLLTMGDGYMLAPAVEVVRVAVG